MTAMTRDLLTQVLQAIDGLEIKGAQFVIGDEHHVNFYLGELGQAMVVRDVEGGSLNDRFLSFTARDSEQTYYVDYDAVTTITTLPPRRKGRAGFA